MFFHYNYICFKIFIVLIIYYFIYYNNNIIIIIFILLIELIFIIEKNFLNKEVEKSTYEFLNV